MATRCQRVGLLALLVLGWLSAAEVARAQFNPYAMPGAMPGMGMNPYSPAGMYGGGMSNPYSASGGRMSNPYSASTGGLGGLGVMPYASVSGNGGLFGVYGGTLYGAAQVLKAQGGVIIDQEKARIERQNYYQAQIETQRKRFDLAMYIRAHTPSYSEELAKTTRYTLSRIQNNASPAEIVSGKALNFILDDARKYTGKTVTMDPIALDADVLKHLNVTKGTQGIGLLRDDGKFTWPVALQEMLPAPLRTELSKQAADLVRKASGFGDKVDANLLKDLRASMDTAREQLLKRVNETPTGQYLEAKRFLTDFEDGLQAIERGEIATQMNYGRFIANGKNVQEVVDYMTKNGLRFAPAVQGDEAAYRALHTALAAFDVQLNSQFNNAAPSDSREPRE